MSVAEQFVETWKVIMVLYAC